MTDEPNIPPSDEVLAEHLNRGECAPDCFGCRVKAIYEDASALTPDDRIRIATSMQNAAGILMALAIREIVEGPKE